MLKQGRNRSPFAGLNVVRWLKNCALLTALLALTSCRTPTPSPSINLQEPGWTLRHGQAVWQLDRSKPDIAGDLLVATKNQQAIVEFTKTPFTIARAYSSSAGWTIEFPPENKRFSGRGNPPQRLSWLHLAQALQGIGPSKPWIFTNNLSDGSWRFHHPRTGETIEGFLTP